MLDTAHSAHVLDSAQIDPERIRPLSRGEYDALVASGLLDGEHLELLEGFLVTMSPQGAFHSDLAARLTALLLRTLDVGDGQVRSHSPLALSEDSEPEPDVAVVPPGDYASELPSHALLVIEVADSSLRKDRMIKARMYAAAGIPEYWIVNLVEEVIEVYRHPEAGAYQHHRRVGVPAGGPGNGPGEQADEMLDLVSFPEVRIPVSAVFHGRWHRR